MLARGVRRAFVEPRPLSRPISTEGTYEQAMRLQREGQLEAAVAAYSQVIVADPEFAEAYYGRATVFYALGSCDQAINDCNRAIELRRFFVEAYLVRGGAYWGIAAQSDPADPLFEAYCKQVVSDCTLVLDYQSHAALAYLNRGLAYWALGNKPRAKHDLENAVTLSKNIGWHEQAEAWLEELKRSSLAEPVSAQLAPYLRKNTRE